MKEQLSIIVATVEHHRLVSVEQRSQLKEIFMDINLWRLLIAFWPKAMQQFVGQSLTNNYGTYFCETFPSLITSVLQADITTQFCLPGTLTHLPSL